MCQGFWWDNRDLNRRIWYRLSHTWATRLFSDGSGSPCRLVWINFSVFGYNETSIPLTQFTLLRTSKAGA